MFRLRKLIRTLVEAQYAQADREREMIFQLSDAFGLPKKAVIDKFPKGLPEVDLDRFQVYLDQLLGSPSGFEVWNKDPGIKILRKLPVFYDMMASLVRAGKVGPDLQSTDVPPDFSYPLRGDLQYVPDEFDKAVPENPEWEAIQNLPIVFRLPKEFEHLRKNVTRAGYRLFHADSGDWIVYHPKHWRPVQHVGEGIVINVRGMMVPDPDPHNINLGEPPDHSDAEAWNEYWDRYMELEDERRELYLLPDHPDDGHPYGEGLDPLSVAAQMMITNGYMNQDHYRYPENIDVDDAQVAFGHTMALSDSEVQPEDYRGRPGWDEFGDMDFDHVVRMIVTNGL